MVIALSELPRCFRGKSRIVCALSAPFDIGKFRATAQAEGEGGNCAFEAAFPERFHCDTHGEACHIWHVLYLQRSYFAFAPSPVTFDAHGRLISDA